MTFASYMKKTSSKSKFNSTAPPNRRAFCIYPSLLICCANHISFKGGYTETNPLLTRPSCSFVMQQTFGRGVIPSTLRQAPMSSASRSLSNFLNSYPHRSTTKVLKNLAQSGIRSPPSVCVREYSTSTNGTACHLPSFPRTNMVLRSGKLQTLVDGSRTPKRRRFARGYGANILKLRLKCVVAALVSKAY